MRIGVVSDTHNNLSNVRKIVEILNTARVERVVHTGDITQAKTLRALAELEVPLVGVYGNNDERGALAEVASEAGFEMVEPSLELAWAGRRILVVHDPLDVDRWWSGHDVVLHGHDHRRRIQRDVERLVFNPGESAGHLEGHNAVGIVDLASLATEIVLF